MNTVDFLKAIWDLPGFYVIGVKQGNKWQWFTPDSPEYVELILERFKTSAEIYYGVNPREKIPEGGKGSDIDIKQANTFFVDLDFKVPQKCKPDIYKDDPQTFELKLCYEENGKTFYVERPPLADVLKKLEDAGLPSPSIVVDSGNGYHILWKNSRPVEAKKWKEIEEELIKRIKQTGLPVDDQVKDLSRILRLPGSVNQRSKREVKVIYVGGVVTILPEKYQRLIRALLPCFKKADDRRFEFVGHLSGFLVRHDVPLEDAEAIVEELYRQAGLEHAEHVKDVKYTYKDHMNGEHVTGLPQLQTLCEELGSPINLKLLEGEKKKKKKKGKKEKAEKKEEETNQTQLDRKPIQSFDILRIYHDFKHEKAYVSTFEAVRERDPEDDRWVNVVKIKNVYVNDGNVHALSHEELEKLSEEYLKIINLEINIDKNPHEYEDLNLPTEIKTDVRIPEVYKKVLSFIKERVTFKWEEDYVAVTIWVMGTYFLRVFTAFPYLAPMKLGYNSGGTMLLLTLKKILPRPKVFNDPTPASIYTTAEKKDASLLFDEFRSNISKERLEEIKNILRVGYYSQGTIPRVLMTKNEGMTPVDFNAYSPKVIIDQSLITSEYDLASRCVFVWLMRDPDRKADISTERPKDLINELYSVFLKYAPQVYSLYINTETEFRGRYDQLYRPLIAIARLIDSEDSTLNVTEQLLIALRRSFEFSESVAIEGDPQKKAIKLILDYITESIGRYIEGDLAKLPEPWHVLENDKDMFYIFVSELRKEVTKRAVEVYQKDISYKFDGKGKMMIGEREWERVDPEIAEMLQTRKFTALLKKFFPENVREHRNNNTFFLRREDYKRIIALNFNQPPTRAETGGVYTPGFNKNQGIRISTQSDEKNTNPSKPPNIPPQIRSDFRSQLNIQNSSTENQNSKSLGELSFNSSLRFSNNNSERKSTVSAQFPLDFRSQIIIESGNNFKEGVEKNKSAQAMASLVQKIQNLLDKILTHGNGSIPLKDLEQDELKLLSAMKERGLIEFNDKSVWITNDGRLYLDGMSVELTVDKIIEKTGYKFTVEELRKAITEVTGCPTPDCVDDWIKTIKRVMMGRFRRTVKDFIERWQGGVDKKEDVKYSTDFEVLSPMPQVVSEHELKIYKLLYRILWHIDAYMPLEKATKDELKLLPELKEQGLVNYDDRAVWLTPDGYYFMQVLEKRVPNIIERLGLEERTEHYGSKKNTPSTE